MSGLTLWAFSCPKPNDTISTGGYPASRAWTHNVPAPIAHNETGRTPSPRNAAKGMRPVSYGLTTSNHSAASLAFSAARRSASTARRAANASSKRASSSFTASVGILAKIGVGLRHHGADLDRLALPRVHVHTELVVAGDDRVREAGLVEILDFLELGQRRERAGAAESPPTLSARNAAGTARADGSRRPRPERPRAARCRDEPGRP